MKRRSVFFTKEQSLMLRGIAIIMVIVSHYVIWFMDLVANEPVRYAMSRLGIYGVDIFFLVSGYGLAKSAAKKRVGWPYWKSRLQNTFVPYLLIAIVIELWIRSEWTPKLCYRLLTGYEYWFIRNILIFYLAFFIVFRLTKKSWLRLVLLTAAVLGYSWWLMEVGRASFWFVSNLSFVIGVALALYEKKLLKAADFGYPVWLLVLAAFMVWVVKSGMDIRFTPVENCDKIVPGMAAGTVWTLLCVQMACLLPGWLGFLKFPGGISLELYLLHTFLYNQIVNYSGISNRLLQGAAAVGVTVLVAWLLHILLEGIWKLPEFWKTKQKL